MMTRFRKPCSGSPVAFIFGGTKGIGLAIATKLERAGWKVVRFSRTSPGGLGSSDLTWIAVDAQQRSSVSRAVEVAVARYGAPKVVISAVGSAHPGYFETLDADVFEAQFKLNLLSAVNIAHEVRPRLIETRGHFVTTSSVLGYVGMFGFTAYCAAKFALIGFSAALRSELRPYGVLVSVLCPPTTDTPGLELENRLKPAEVRRAEERGGVLCADQVAAVLVRALMRDRFLILPSWSARILHFASRWFPECTARHLMPARPVPREPPPCQVEFRP